MKIPILISATLLGCMNFQGFGQSNTVVSSTHAMPTGTNTPAEPSTAETQSLTARPLNPPIHLTPEQKIKLVRLQGFDPSQWTVSDDGRYLTTIQKPLPEVNFSNAPPAPIGNQVVTGPREPMAMLYLDQFMGTTNLNLLVKVSGLVAVKQDYLKFNFGGSKFDYSGHYAIWIPQARKHSTPVFGLQEKAKAVSIHTSGLVTVLPNVTVWEKGPGFIDIGCNGIECICSGGFEIFN